MAEIENVLDEEASKLYQQLHGIDENYGKDRMAEGLEKQTQNSGVRSSFFTLRKEKKGSNPFLTFSTKFLVRPRQQIVMFGKEAILSFLGLKTAI